MSCKNCKHVDRNGMCTWPDNNGPKPCAVRPAEEKYEKPTLGLMPRSVWDTMRAKEIFEAMERYATEGKTVPVEWVQELQEIALRGVKDVGE